ncbi:LysR family transcriptional regulator substrate-binding protein, partial [Actinomycetes bacterium KLBMP 9797]
LPSHPAPHICLSRLAARLDHEKVNTPSHTGHPLAGRRQVRLTDLDGMPLVVPPAGRAHRRALDRALLDAGVAWQVAAEVDGSDLLVHLTSLGLGATVVNGCVPAPAGVSAVPIRDLPAVRYWSACRHERLPLVRDLFDELSRP